MFFYEMVNRITSREYKPIFDTDFASLFRYDRFPSLRHGSGATFSKIGLWYGGAAKRQGSRMKAGGRTQRPARQDPEDQGSRIMYLVLARMSILGKIRT